MSEARADVMNDELKGLLLEYEKISQVLKARQEDRGMDFYVPNPVQDKFHRSKAKTIAFCAGNRGGKCLPLDTPILMSDGLWKPLKDVKVGDRVVSENGSGIVTDKINSGLRECYKIFFEDGGYLIASKEHTFPVSYRSGRNTVFKKRTICELLRRKPNLSISKKTRFLSYKNIEFDTEFGLPLHPYLVGALLGDGSLTKGSAGFTNSDEGVISLVNSLLNNIGFKLKFRNKYHYGIVSIEKIKRSPLGQFQKSKFSEIIRSLGMDKRANFKSIPEIYKRSSLKSRKALLAGLIDTDGANDEFCSISQRLASDFCFIVKSMGGKATLSKTIKTCTNSPTKRKVEAWRVYWRLYEELPLIRKDKQSQPTKRAINYNHRIVKKIEHVGMLECQDITISNKSHNFVSWDWIVTGNSSAGAMEVAWAVTKKYPDWFPKERRFNRPVKIRIATDKFFKIDTVIEPKLKTYLPKGEIVRVKRSPQGYVMKMTTRDGSFIEFLTMEQDPMAFEGQDLDLFWGDEPVERKKYVATQRGLVDRGGQTILTFTPLIEPWMKEEIIDKSDGTNIDVFLADTRDNKFDIQGNPILLEEDIKRFEDLLTEDERETRIHGKFFHMRGLVYKELNPQVHFIENFEYETNYPVVCVLDPHDRLPHWVIWAMIDRINDVFVMYEMIREGTIAELASYIRATEKYFGWNVVKRLIDPNFGRKPLLGTGLSVIDELWKNKVSFACADDNKEAGHLKVKEMIHYDPKRPIDINNKPKLFFVKNKVPRTIHSMLNYQYDEWKGGQDKDPKEDTKAKDAHGADVVRYLCISCPAFALPSIYEPQEAFY